MGNPSAAFARTSQGLDQLTSTVMQREIMQAEMTRAENLAALKDHLTTRRELLITNTRGNVLKDVSSQRAAAEHANRDEEIDRQEASRARNQAAAQRQQLIDTGQAQDNAFTNQGELQARAAGRTARVQASRDAIVQASQARATKAQIRSWLTKYVATSHERGGTGGTDTTLAGDPLDSQQLAQRARHDSVLASQLQAYKDADAREQAAQSTMSGMGSPYVMTLLAVHLVAVARLRPSFHPRAMKGRESAITRTLLQAALMRCGCRAVVAAARATTVMMTAAITSCDVGT